MDDPGPLVRSLLAAGDRRAALRAAEAWLDAHPESAEASNAIGNAHVALGDLRAAAAAFRRATELDPTLSKAHSNLGSALRSLGELASAVSSLERAVAVDATNARAWTNLGNAMRQSGRRDEALDAYRRALALRPSAGARYNLGTLYAERGHLRDAEVELRESLRLEPDGPNADLARESLIDVLVGSGKVEEARATVARATGVAAALARLALARATLQIAGPEQAARAIDGLDIDETTRGPFAALIARIREAEGDLDGAERAATDAAESTGTAAAWCEVARIRTRRRDARGADDALDRALAVEPSAAAPELYRGESLLMRNELSAAEAAFGAAARKAPAAPEPISNLAQVALRRGDAARAIELYRDALGRGAPHPIVHSNLLMAMHYRARPPDELLRESLAWSRAHLARASVATFAAPGSRPRRLRVGYVSADLRKHAVARFFERLLAHHDRTRFEIVLYNASEYRDATTARLSAHGDAWRDVHVVGDHRLASIIRDDAIDVLVDLGGHTAGSRIRALGERPAPVLVSFLGYPGTTGVAAVDARITDAHADPIGGADRYATEQLARLPRCAWLFQPDPETPDVAARSTGDPVVFAVFNNVAKITEEARRAFAKILRRVPGSRLLFKARTLDDAETRERFLLAFAEAGVAERVELRSWVLAHGDHLATYSEVDIQLDSFPYAGTTTTCESMWMGVPVVTLAGDRHAGRVGVSLLRAVGLDELIAKDVDEYITKAAALAQDRVRLHDMRTTLRDRMRRSELCDGVGYARAIEQVFDRSFETWRAFASSTGTSGDAWLPLPDGAVVSVPDEVGCASRFVLEERGDWFEDEMSFVRAYLGEGDVAADVGANFGVYALSMAKRVGGSGRVLAFEPSPITAAHLRRSAARAPAVHVVEAAVADVPGRGHLDGAASPELEQLVSDVRDRSRLVEVEIVTLDALAEHLEGVALIKVDAERAEQRVLAGAARLLEKEDPVWMWELRHGSETNRALFDQLARSAPHLFAMRWIAPLNLLVPLDLEGELDRRWLNFFTLSRARHSELRARGLAVALDLAEPAVTRADGAARDHRSRAFARADATERHRDLCGALVMARREAEGAPSVEAVFTHVRVAHELARDGEAVRSLDALIARLDETMAASGSSFSLTPLPSQEPRRGKLGAREVEAFALEARLRLGAWSSYYAFDRHRAWLARLAELGGLTPELRRMRDVVERHAERSVRT